MFCSLWVGWSSEVPDRSGAPSPAASAGSSATATAIAAAILLIMAGTPSAGGSEMSDPTGAPPAVLSGVRAPGQGRGQGAGCAKPNVWKEYHHAAAEYRLSRGHDRAKCEVAEPAATG